MAVFNVELNVDKNKKDMIKDIFKYSVILIIFHSLTNTSNIKNFGLIGDEILNDNFLLFLAFIALSFLTYYLVVLELVEIL